MKESDKKFWLYIEPDVYCNIKDNKLFLYKTKNNTVIENTSSEIISLIQSLYEKHNLGAVYFDGENLKNTIFSDFIDEFCRKQMGNIVDTRFVTKKPIQLMPVLNLQHDIEKNKDSVGEGILSYLTEVNLYINQVCLVNCHFCNDYYRQNLCCTKKNEKDEISSVNTLKKLLEQIKYSPVSKLNILGGNILQHPYIKNFIPALSDFKEFTYLWIHYKNIVIHKGDFYDFKYVIPVTFPIDKTSFTNCISLMKDKQVSYHFFITNKNEYHQLEQLTTENEIKDYKISPFYTKNNQAFFEENIYLNKEDIFVERIPFRKIFAHQKLNTISFGSLTIMPDGNVYANVNSPVIGNIKTDSILCLIDKEMRINTAWRKIRNKKPCNDCSYQYLCPSPSNYELAIGKPNLCHVKP
ncbi:MAG: TIGR04150 pseudo-rSAM protein [Dysgonamonadaceae bacterium]|jgi:pseudo-rSAM protein|nr:TIGR04150 pseudo-rSAM protein [Dysgonamonadaceae bacterium]